MELNRNFNDIKESYLFAEVGARASAYASAHPDKQVLKLGIGDVTLPLVPAVIDALHKAVDEMADRKSTRLNSSHIH